MTNAESEELKHPVARGGLREYKRHAPMAAPFRSLGPDRSLCSREVGFQPGPRPRTRKTRRHQYRDARTPRGPSSYFLALQTGSVFRPQRPVVKDDRVPQRSVRLAFAVAGKIPKESLELLGAAKRAPRWARTVLRDG